MCARVYKVKQNFDVFLDLFWLTCRLPKTLVLFLHTNTVPEATKKKARQTHKPMWSGGEVVEGIQLIQLTVRELIHFLASLLYTM